MKIPETSANVGAYYGNEENGQWQPNGVIIDSGVGGGVVGSGDAGVHRPPVYPVHIPRAHIPAGYVMAGAYYPPQYPPAPPAQPDDFEDYMWMENEEEFDKQVMQQLEEEALMEQCIEAMLEDEQREQRQRPVSNGHNHPTTSNGSGSLSLEEAVSRSTLNPLAAEFVPNRARQPPGKEKGKTEIGSDKNVLDDSTQPPWWDEQCYQLKNDRKLAEKAYNKAMTKENFRAWLKIDSKYKSVIRKKKKKFAEEKQQEKREIANTEVKTEVKTEAESLKEVVTEVTQKDSVDGKEEQITEQSNTEESIPPPSEPPEVSAADILPIDSDKDKRSPKDVKKDVKPKVDVKKTPKVDVKKAKPVAVKSEPRVQAKKKESSVKVVKSEVRVDEREETPVPDTVTQPTPPVTEESTQPGIKPINYAAAAKANKPKKPTTPPVTEKTPPPQPTKTDKIQKQPIIKDSRVKTDKTTPKMEKTSVQRKTSLK